MNDFKRTEYVRLANVLLNSHITFYDSDIDEDQVANLEVVTTLLEKACGDTLESDRKLFQDFVRQHISENA